MKKNVWTIILIGIVGLVSDTLFADQLSVDSLRRAISKETNEIKLANSMLDLATEQFGKDFAEVEILLQRADSLFFKNSDKSGLARTLNLKGNYYRFNNKNDEALKCYYNALKINEQIGNFQEQINNYGNIGQMHAVMEEYDEAIIFANKSLTACRSINYYRGISWAYYDIAQAYFMKRNFDSAEYYYRKLNHHANKIKHLSGEGISLIGLSELLFVRNDSAKAISLLNTAIDIFVRLKNDYHLAVCYTMIANCYLSTKDFQAARMNFEKAKHIATKLNHPNLLKESLSGLARLSAGDGNYKEAYLNYLQSDLIDDSLARIQSTLSLSNLNRKYLKDKVLKDNQILRQNIELQNYSRNILIIIVLALLIMFLILIFRIIEKNKMNRAILVSNQELSEVNSTKDKFFSIIAHDLKNPLGSFRSMMELMVDEYDSFDEAERKEFLMLIKNSSIQVYSLLENLLEWSRSQRGLIKFNPNDTNLQMLAQNSITVLRLQADKKQIKLVNNIQSNIRIFADENLITTVIRNLMSNAIKFTHEGGEIKVGVINPTDDAITCYIQDSGIGMSEDVISRLFKIDDTITSKGTADEAGTGLGLILCKEFIEKHGGTIWAESEVGKGSTFYFTLSTK